MNRHHILRRPTAIHALSLLVLVAFGCSGEPGQSGELGPGAYVDEHVPPTVRTSLEEAAGKFYASIRSGNPEMVLAQVALAARSQITADQFLESVQRIAGTFGMPEDMSTDSVVLVKFGPGYPHAARVRAPVEGMDDDAELLLTPHPEQASLVQIGRVGEERAYFSTLWFKEEAGWRVAAFFAKPATMVGRDWRDYSEEAASQRLAKNNRNAAILYNLAIDLTVPAAWIKPAGVAELQRAQKRIMVTQLPTGKPEVWGAAPDTFSVARVGYGWVPEGLTVYVQYQATGTDSLSEAPHSERLRDYVVETFPEYREVFTGMSAVGYRPGESTPVLSRNFFWKDGS